MPLLGQDGFRIKLNALDWQGFMADPHDFAVLCPRCNLQAIGKAVALNYKRMIASGVKWIWQAAEQTRAIVKNR